VDVVGLRDIQVFKGVVFDEQAPSSVDVELAPASADDGVEAVVRDPRADRAHYRATVLTADGGAVPAPAAVEPLPPGEGESLASAYGGPLFHGPTLRGLVAQEDDADGRLVLRCRLREVHVDDGAWAGRRYSPVLADLLLQGCLLWVWRQTGLPSLPLGVQAVDIFDRLPDDADFQVVVAGAGASGPRIRCDVTAYSADGRPLLRMSGVQLVASGGLAEAFVPAAAKPGTHARTAT
jgi:Polyketide synthase dehydratase